MSDCKIFIAIRIHNRFPLKVVYSEFRYEHAEQDSLSVFLNFFYMISD